MPAAGARPVPAPRGCSRQGRCWCPRVLRGLHREQSLEPAELGRAGTGPLTCYLQMKVDGAVQGLGWTWSRSWTAEQRDAPVLAALALPCAALAFHCGRAWL